MSRRDLQHVTTALWRFSRGEAKRRYTVADLDAFSADEARRFLADGPAAGSPVGRVKTAKKACVAKDVEIAGSATPDEPSRT